MSSNVKEYAEEQGIAVKQDASLAEVLPAQGMGGEPDSSDYAIPFIKLVQASSEEVKDGTAKPGVFLSSEGGTVEYLDFVPLHIQFIRDFYNADAAKNLCYSGDRVTGHPRDRQYFAQAGVELTEGETLACADCPFNNMPAFEKLACKKGYVVTGYDIDRESPFLFRVKGSAVNVFKNRLIGAVAMGRSVPWARAFQMTSAKKSNGGNSWFAPELQPTKGYDDSEKAFWAAMSAGFVVEPTEHAESVDADDLPFE